MSFTLFFAILSKRRANEFPQQHHELTKVIESDDFLSSSDSDKERNDTQEDNVEKGKEQQPKQKFHKLPYKKQGKKLMTLLPNQDLSEEMTLDMLIGDSNTADQNRDTSIGQNISDFSSFS